MILLIFGHLSNHPTHKSWLMGCTMVHVSTLQSGDLYQQVFGCIALIAGHCNLNLAVSPQDQRIKSYGKWMKVVWQGESHYSGVPANFPWYYQPLVPSKSRYEFFASNRTSKTCANIANISLKDQMTSIGDETYEFRSLCIYTHQSMSSHKFQK